MRNNTLTILQAYNAMLIFLDDYYFNKNEPDDLGSLLGGMQLFSDGGTFDPAMWREWLECIVTNKNLTPSEAFDGMRKFLELYDSYINSSEIKSLLDCMKKLPEGNYDRIIWKQWTNAISSV